MSLDFNDQSEEIEVLQSIFPTEFTLLSGSDEAVGHHRFKIQLQPTTIDADNHGESLSILYLIDDDVPSRLIEMSGSIISISSPSSASSSLSL